MKHLQKFEEFIGDLETDEIKKMAVDQEEKDGDRIIVDPDVNDPVTQGSDDIDDEF